MFGKKIKKGMVKSSKAEGFIGHLIKKEGWLVHSQHQIRGKPWFYDFYLPELNLLIEYNGDLWHANPATYNRHDIINFPNGTSKTAGEIWSRDAAKKKDALAAGYKYAVIWESDYTENGFSHIRRFLK